MAKYTKKEVSRLIKEINEDYDFVGDYVNNATPLKIKHTPCGNSFDRTLGSFKRTQKCPHCQGGRNRWNTEKVKEYIDRKTKGSYSLVSEYKHFKEYIVVRHNECNNEYEVTFDAFKSGNRCPKCGRKRAAEKQLKSQTAFEKEVEKLTDGMFEVVSKYNGAYREVGLYHKKCGTTIRKIPHNFLNIPSCPACGGFSAWTTDEYRNYIAKLTEGEYDIVGEYVPDKKGKTTFFHSSCSKEFEMLASNFTSGEQRCPYCRPNLSKAELKIRNILSELGVTYEEQYRFDDCKDKSMLPFDFAIIEKGKLQGLIEYDGLQHFRGWGSDKEDLENIKRRDSIKDNYCKNNDIPLVRITYKEYSNLEIKVKGAIDWIQQQNTQIESSLERF